jgi:hypothetical protein
MSNIKTKMLTHGLHMYHSAIHVHDMYAHAGVEVELHTFLTSALRVVEWSDSQPVRFTHGNTFRKKCSKEMEGELHDHLRCQ